GLLPAQLVGVHIARDLVEPRAEITIRLIALAVFQNPEKHLLGQILAQCPVGSQILEVAKDPRMMPVEQQFQLADRPLPDLPHHLFVFHVSPQSRPITLCNTWEIKKGYANS